MGQRIPPADAAAPADAGPPPAAAPTAEPLAALQTATFPSPLRAWLYLVWLCMARQARMRQMVWIALGLLGFSITLVAINTAATGWNLHQRRFVYRTREDDQRHVTTYKDATDYPQWLSWAVPRSPLTPQWEQAVFASARAVLDRSAFTVFVQAIMLSGPSLLLNFLVPIWCLSFATDSIGGDRESRNLIWLLTRPMPRALVYLAKFVSVLPWTLGLNLGGFGLLCLAGGRPGREAFGLFWPAIGCATVAFTALFLLIGAAFRRPAVVAIVYSFFLEIILGNMPGFLKRASISFYARCMMYDAAADRQIGPRFPQIFLAVDGVTALVVLLGTTIALLVVGMIVFSRTEYNEAS
jgi:ABC-type transport system involved in multi-copper enzyme maturation permease subunit